MKYHGRKQDEEIFPAHVVRAPNDSTRMLRDDQKCDYGCDHSPNGEEDRHSCEQMVLRFRYLLQKECSIRWH